MNPPLGLKPRVPDFNLAKHLTDLECQAAEREARLGRFFRLGV